MKDGGAYFKVTRSICVKFQNCSIVFFPDNNEELPSSCTILYIPQFIVVFIVSLFFVLVSIAFSFS